MKPKKPFMIERDGRQFGKPGDDFALIRYKDNIVSDENMRVRWVDWDGSRYATKAEAQFIIDNTPGMEGAQVIEIIDEVRMRVRA